jgi:putative ABC transport system permease protein
MIHPFILRLKLLVFGPPASEVDEELSFHIEQSVARLVVGEAMWLVLPGLALNAIGIWAGTRLLGALLLGAKPLDPWMSAASVALLLGCALAACAIPTRRAASVDPLESLRLE